MTIRAMAARLAIKRRAAQVPSAALVETLAARTARKVSAEANRRIAAHDESVSFHSFAALIWAEEDSRKWN